MQIPYFKLFKTKKKITDGQKYLVLNSIEGNKLKPYRWTLDPESRDNINYCIDNNFNNTAFFFWPEHGVFQCLLIPDEECFEFMVNLYNETLEMQKECLMKIQSKDFINFIEEN